LHRVFIRHDPKHNAYYNEENSFDNQGGKFIWIVTPDAPHPAQPNSADGSTATLVFFGGGGIASTGPAWSPDGSKLALSSSARLSNDDHYPASANIWVVKPDGSAPEPLTTQTMAGGSWRPLWSPDGTKILFESVNALDGSDRKNGGNSTSNIWAMNADGSDPTPLTKLRAVTSSEASWRP
jgi:dipeptidyl aminopeptidase/acylaminoacyl peptidase